MDINTIIIVLAVVGAFEGGRWLIKSYFHKKFGQHQQIGYNTAVTQIYTQIKKAGKITLTLDGNAIEVVEVNNKVKQDVNNHRGQSDNKSNG